MLEHRGAALACSSTFETSRTPLDLPFTFSQTLLFYPPLRPPHGPLRGHQSSTPLPLPSSDRTCLSSKLQTFLFTHSYSATRLPALSSRSLCPLSRSFPSSLYTRVYRSSSLSFWLFPLLPRRSSRKHRHSYRSRPSESRNFLVA